MTETAKNLELCMIPNTLALQKKCYIVFPFWTLVIITT